ncbi:COG4315 family predicted lipoprotein [Glutamicibacter protophormiae]
MKSSLKSWCAATSAVAALALALSGCAGDSGSTDTASPSAGAQSSPVSSAPAQSSPSSGMQATSLALADSSLGKIVVDGKGMTVYQFDTDTKGADSSACSGPCKDQWPAVPGGTDVTVDGVTGKTGTITGVNGESQLTLNGWPLYYFAGDKKAGDTAGQGVKDVWWVLDAAGTPIK